MDYGMLGEHQQENGNNHAAILQNVQLSDLSHTKMLWHIL